MRFHGCNGYNDLFGYTCVPAVCLKKRAQCKAIAGHAALLLARFTGLHDQESNNVPHIISYHSFLG